MALTHGFEGVFVCGDTVTLIMRHSLLKMWGRMKTIVRRLLALGVPIQQAVGLGRSRKKWWRRSKNPVINKALSDKYLANQGLVSIKDLWVQFHYPK